MAELVDALVSEASEETHGSSSLLGHTNLINNYENRSLFDMLLFKEG